MGAEEWTLDLGTYRTAATRSRRGETVDVDLDDDGLDVDAEAGSGYLREHTKVHVPLPVLLQLLEARGLVPSKARVERLEAALELATQALGCVSCAEDVPPCPDHGDPIEAIQVALLPDASDSPSGGSDG